MARTTTISLDKAYLVAIWLETLFYGVNIVLFGSYLYISRYKHRARKIKRVIMVSAITMFLFSTIHVSLGLVRLIQGFIEFRDAPGGPAAFVADTSAPVNVAKIIIHTINSIIGDSIVVWRCYHVWAANIYICILPILLIAASAVSGLGQGIIFAQDKTGDGTFSRLRLTFVGCGCRWL
ncbi:uncharacterized protein STEHIDRAFT_155000 [Stereum hirsutum FP-91666 SS1]|uniref:uncharacterized protein n=1 Tax=Stereum hirsutum (strain FP-91666) TaxID=721885 RepID=UPI000440A5E9|nr:uncharacterized protein STEHIDRAFT_155000 [Stereum hirsutum FP-91666 SS1]EIM89321.1 hypothetical protein STEHIDRAFT_155000 [Stereum hirsutum FP-91666 SS1]